MGDISAVHANVSGFGNLKDQGVKKVLGGLGSYRIGSSAEGGVNQNTTAKRIAQEVKGFFESMKNGNTLPYVASKVDFRARISTVRDVKQGVQESISNRGKVIEAHVREFFKNFSDPGKVKSHFQNMKEKIDSGLTKGSVLIDRGLRKAVKGLVDRGKLKAIGQKIDSGLTKGSDFIDKGLNKAVKSFMKRFLGVQEPPNNYEEMLKAFKQGIKDAEVRMGLNGTETPAQVKKQYLKLSREMHPDKADPNSTAEQIKKKTERFQVLNNDYKFLLEAKEWMEKQKSNNK